MGFIMRQGPHQLALKSNKTALCMAPCMPTAHSQPLEGCARTSNHQMF